ncbi:MAG TPA: nuclear transport factor 2 family protein [Rhizomicrobium sp.]|nr:nuclear transport factor 2 family protein [Rhizomicrobium sp.]
MRSVILAVSAIAALAATPALADDRAIITKAQQDMSDAIVPGDVAVWDKYLDPKVIIAEEDGSFKGKADMLKEIAPMPKGLSGNIKVELLSYSEDGDTAVALFREHETEHYYGQTIHASYLSNTTWKKRPDNWKLIEVQLIAERTDPPAITLPATDLQKFAGTYKLRDSEPTYTLAMDGGKLMGGRPGRKPSEWNAETRDVFFIKGDPRIRKIFQYDANGNVTGFIERRESWTLYWDKLG